MYQYVSMQRFLSFLGMGAAIGIGSLLFGIVILRDMKMVLKSTNDNAISGEQNKLEALKKLSEFIGIHAMAKELSMGD